MDAFLVARYEIDHNNDSYRAYNVILAPNNWGAGIALEKTLLFLSQKHSFTVYMTAGWAFKEVSMMEETGRRLKDIHEAFEDSGKLSEH